MALIGDRPEGEAEWPLADACGHAVTHTGKQLRPRLVAEASRLGSPPDEEVVKAMCAVELLHVATLSHDDVVDATPLRRGAPSVEGRFGAFAAEYAGGWMLGRALELAAELGEPALAQFSDAVCELCEGEMLETQELRNPGRSEESYLAAIEGKTASLFRLSALLGGTLAGVDARALGALREYGHWLGMAFQLADDLGDLLADAAATGKERGTDLRQGVFTLPVVYALGSDPELAALLCDEIDAAAVDAIVDRI
ncbi:MAG TPA: polyprenyl synthetase family protein, partial [Thermoleophilaceae bacterium]